MKDVRAIMGMPVTIEIADSDTAQSSLEKAFEYFTYVDKKFSTYKIDSEISEINRGERSPHEYSDDTKEIFARALQTKTETDGYFDIQTPQGLIDPSGIVKGWAIQNVANMLRELGHSHIYVEAGGDIQTYGLNAEGGRWSIGIRNPFNRFEIIKVLYPDGRGVATSGEYIRGDHIYDPHTKKPVQTPVVSFTVIGPDIYEADRFATAAFAMGERGVSFIEKLSGFEAYSVTADGVATMTSGFQAYTL